MNEDKNSEHNWFETFLYSCRIHTYTHMESIEEIDEDLGYFSDERLEHIQDIMASEVMKSYRLWTKNIDRLRRVKKEIERRKDEGRY